jgi:hypothetical protein
MEEVKQELPQKNEPAKKSYETPELAEHGTVEALTEVVPFSGQTF